MKVRTDEVGVKVSRDKRQRPEVPGAVRILQGLRLINAAAIVAMTVLAGLNLGLGHVAVVVLLLIAALVNVAAVVVQTRLIRKKKAELRPRPDYSLIASMERPIWGEAFEHAGAPGASVSYVPMTGGTTSGLIRLPARNAQGGAVGCDHERPIELRSHIGRVGWICGACGERLSHYPHHP